MKKECSKCNNIKPLEEFHKKKKGKYGVESKCKLCKKEYDKQRKLKNPEKIKEIHKNYREKNKEVILEKQRIYRDQNRESYNAYQKEYRKERRKNDSLFKLTDNIRTLIGNSIRNRKYSKKSKIINILGCSIEELHKHLIKTFEDRYGIEFCNKEYEVHIDHVIPLSSAKTEDDILKLNHYSNLQYLYASDNLNKSNKINWE